MLAKTESVALIGTEARLVEVEVDVAETGVPAFRIVGLPAKSVTEAEQRVRAALESSGERWPLRRMTANLAPGALRKEGAHFDLAIALGVVAANEQLAPDAARGWILVGELALDGSIRRVKGVLAAAIECKRLGRKGILCPPGNAPEAAVVDDVDVVPVSTLRQAMLFLKGEWESPVIEPRPPTKDDFTEDLCEVKGHADAKRALELAAAGGHNLMMLGPPGSGKTMLARRLPGILPPLSREEAIDVTRVYSVAGLLDENTGLLERRPLRAPHHHVTVAGMVGGGAGLAQPGEISLANHGCLFLDEIPLFRSTVLESLRGPLEDGVVRIARSGGVVTYPARFSLIAAMNPCPCGYGDTKGKRCRCTGIQLQHYRNKLSGPLMDRFDLQVLMPRPSKQDLMKDVHGERSEAVRERVVRARAIQARRYGRDVTNAACRNSELMQHAGLTREATLLLTDTLDRDSVTGRGLARLIRVSRTLADLDDEAQIREHHVADALRYRFLASQEVAA